MEKVLIVDDEEEMRLMLQESLGREGYSFAEAGDGVQAQAIIGLESGAIDAVILDWKMPKMDGLEVLRWVKEDPAHEQIPIIMHTALDDPEHIRRGIDAGAFYYLMKGGPPELLRTIVRTAISDYHYKRSLLEKIREGENPFKLMIEGTFRFRTLEEGEYLSLSIANSTPFPDKVIPLSELLTNAVEHGNLNIGYEEKTRLVAGGMLSGAIRERLALPAFARKFVEVSIRRTPEDITVRITDQGDGFDFRKYLTLDEHRAFDNHGRGIAIANASLTLEYIGKGNEVWVRIPGTGSV